MILEIGVLLIAIALIAGNLCFAIFLYKAWRTLKSTSNDLHHASTEAISMIKKTKELTTDIQAKSQSLDYFFHSLRWIGRHKSTENEGAETLSEIADWIRSSLILLIKLKHSAKRRGK